jgi:hypothetical protein
MNSHVRWLNDDKTILLQVHAEKFTLTDLYRVIDETYVMASSVPYTVHLIVDLTKVVQLPTSSISGMRYAAGKNFPNRGIMVSVGLGNFMESVLGIINKVYPKMSGNTYAVRTFEEAEEIIRAHQQSPR